MLNEIAARGHRPHAAESKMAFLDGILHRCAKSPDVETTLDKKLTAHFNKIVT